MKKLDVVNFLRGYSIFTIVIMHLVGMLGISGVWEKAAAFGGAGVHVFILCSGFGLYLSYLRKPLGYIAFLKKRFTRIYMPMAVLCVATAVWMACMGREWFMPLLGNLLLFKMFVPELESSMGGQMWFVSTIIQFYLAWPLIVKLFNIRGGKACAHCQPVMVYIRRPIRICRGAGLEQFLPAIFVGVLLRNEDGRNISWQS